MPLFPVITPTDVSELAREATQLEVAEKALWVPGVDSLFWPCIAGEDDPPAFGDATAAYSTHGGLSCVRSTTAGGTVIWPGQPRSRGERTVMRIQFNDAEATPNGNHNASRTFRYGAAGGPMVELLLQDEDSSPDKRYMLTTVDAAGLSQDSGGLQSIGIPRDDDWHQWELRLLDNRVELYRDTLLVRTHSTRFWPSTVGASSYQLLYVAGTGSPSGHTSNLAQLSIQWERESWLAA